jgi:hypothetical protein
VDVDDDPKLVKFCLNKAPPGIGRKLVKTLKGTGFSKVAITLEDGTAVETVADEEEPAAEGQQPAPKGAASPAPEAPSSAPPAAPSAAPQDAAPAAAPSADTGQLTRALTDLVKRLAQAAPEQVNALKALAVQAQAALKAGDANGAGAAIAQLRDGLDKPAAPAADASAEPAASPDHATPAALAKARQAWVLTRKKMESDVDAVHKAVMSAFKGHGAEKDISTAFRTRVEAVMTSLDEALAHALDELANAVDPRAHAALVQKIMTLLTRYENFVATDPTIAALDGNPFAPVAIRKTTTATLAALRKTVR